MLFSIGADVEVFAKSGNNHKSLCGLIGGTKEEPKQVEGVSKGFMVQEDNVSLEFNIPPCNSRNAFVSSISWMKEYSKTLIEQNGFELSTLSSASFSAEELTHPNALIFGCEPDYDAWKKVENKKPKADDPYLRTAGGHVHVGTDVDMIKGIQLMDLYLGVPSVILDNNEASITRRKLYGKAGAMRPKPYGFEYRVLSNFWIFKEQYIKWVYEQTAKAMNKNITFSAKEGKEIQRVINEGDIDGAKHLVNHYGLALPSVV